MAIATALPDGNGVDLYCQVRQRPGLSLTRAVLLADSKMSKYRAVVDTSPMSASVFRWLPKRSPL